MNKEIKKLAEQAGMVMYPTGLGVSENTIWGDRNIEKFAELIAHECMDLALGSSHREDDMGAIIANKIKKHFGVK